MIGCKVFSENDLKLMEEYMTIAISTALPHAPYHLVRDLYTLPHTLSICCSIFTLIFGSTICTVMLNAEVQLKKHNNKNHLK